MSIARHDEWVTLRQQLAILRFHYKLSFAEMDEIDEDRFAALWNEFDFIRHEGHIPH